MNEKHTPHNPDDDHTSEINTVAFDAFNQLAEVNEALDAVNAKMTDLNRARHEGTITQDEYAEQYEQLIQNDLEFLELKKQELESIIDPPEASKVKKFARGVTNILRRNK